MGGRLFSQRARRPFVPGVPRPPTNIVHSLWTAEAKRLQEDSRLPLDRCHALLGCPAAG
jgi:hypothetical protein